MTSWHARPLIRSRHFTRRCVPGLRAAFEEPTAPQALGWPAIARGESTLILAPTGSGKTLTAFLWCLDRLMFSPQPPKARRCRVLYVSPLKALAVDVERNLRAPLAGIAQVAERLGEPFVAPAIAIRTGDTPQSERARFQREPADILITTPESLYLLLTSNAREALSSIETVIIDEIHALVPTKRGAHLAVSLERLEERCERPPQRIGLSATQRPLDEVARFLGGTESTRVAAATNRPGPPDRGRERPALRRTEDRCRNRARVHGAPRRRPLSPRHHRRCRQEESTQADHRGAGRGHGEADDGGRHSERAGIGRRFASVDLVGDPPAAARADSRAPIDPDLRQQPPSGRTAGRRAERTGRRNARALASRVDRAAAAGRGRGSVEGRSAPRRSSPPRRSSSASTWARSISSSRSKRRRRSPAACSASAAAAIRPTRSAKASCSRNSAGIWWRAPPSPRRCTTAPSKPHAFRGTRSTSSRSSSSRWRQWTTGPSTRCSRRSGAPRRSRS